MRKFYIMLAVIVIAAMTLVSGCAQQVSTPAAVGEPTSSSATQKFTWNLQLSLPDGVAVTDEIKIFAKQVETFTGGRLVIKVQPLGALVAIPEMLNAAGAGSVEMVVVALPWYAGKDPAFNMWSSGPFNLPPLLQEIWMTKWPGTWELLEGQCASFNVLPIGIMFGSECLMSKVPIRSLQDFKGVRVRTAGYGTSFFKELGAAPMAVTGEDIYLSLERGLVDAVEYGGLGVNLKSGYGEVTKYIISPVLHSPSYDQTILVSKSAWDKLPNDIKEIVSTLGKYWGMSDTLATEYEDISQLDRVIMKEKKMEQIVLSDADVATAIKIGEKIGEEASKANALSTQIWNSLKAFEKAYNIQKGQYGWK